MRPEAPKKTPTQLGRRCPSPWGAQPQRHSGTEKGKPKVTQAEQIGQYLLAAGFLRAIPRPAAAAFCFGHPAPRSPRASCSACPPACLERPIPTPATRRPSIHGADRTDPPKKGGDGHLNTCRGGLTNPKRVCWPALEPAVLGRAREGSSRAFKFCANQPTQRLCPISGRRPACRSGPPADIARGAFGLATQAAAEAGAVD